VPISNAAPFVGSKNFVIALSDASLGATLGNPSSADVTINGDAVPAAGNLQFSAPSESVAQNAGTTPITVNRVGGSAGAISAAYATQSGSAQSGTDFAPASGTLTWADGDATAKTISIAVLNATPFSGNKTFSVALTKPQGTAIVNPGTTTVTIAGDAVLPVGSVEFSAASLTVLQNVGQAMVTVNRVGGSNGAIGVSYQTADGTAVGGKDFTASNGSVQWSSGDATPKTIAIPISNATPFAGTKSFTITLATPSGGATLGNPVSAGVAITGDAQAATGSIQLSATGYSVNQSAGTVSLAVNRTGGSSGPLSVTYATANGSAAAGIDFTAISGTLSWVDGEVASKSLSIPISNTTPFSGTKAFSLVLSGAAGTLGSPSSAGITITGDAQAGSVQLSASSYTVAQSAGSVTITASRTGGSSGAINVSYTTANGTAVGGSDFSAASGNLSWADGDTAAKSFSVPISSATPFSGSKTFTVSLSNATAGVTLGSPSSATVSITGAALAGAGNVELSSSSYAVNQTSGTLTVTVNRTAGSSGAISVAYSTASGTAVAGSDFTSASGTLSWADGDATSKTFSVSISNATAFAGTKTFTVALSNPTNGATLNAPSSATVTISGSGITGGSGPSAPTSLVITGQSQNSISMTWSAAAPGPAPIAQYKIYRNGAAYATTTSTSYTDTNATNANSPVTNSGPTVTTANTVYSYAVSAVDTAGNEGPQQSNATFWVYYNGVFNWLGDYSYPGGSININYADATGAPESGAADIEVSFNVAHAGFQPYAGKTVTQWDMEGGSFKYLSIDLKPTQPGQDWEILVLSRLPPGDVTPWGNATLSKYGPAPVVGQWATYKIPLSAVSIGYTNFTGSISGTTLTVTSVSSGVGLDGGGFITGPGIPAGTYVNGYGQSGGGAGTYTLAGPGISASTSIPSTAMVEQRTGIYKFALVDRNANNLNNNSYYVDNIKFTVN
jgi:hypothetical protein